MHVVIDGFGGDATLLGDRALVLGLLERLPGEIGMTPISEPHIHDFRGKKIGDWGVCGLVFIAESHISVHTMPARQIVLVDIFSCRGFEDAKAVDLVIETFGLAGTRVYRLERGLEYPIEPQAQSGEHAEVGG